jgi:hypothetical protein
MAIKFLHNLDVQGNIDLNNNQLTNVVIQHLATDPAAVEGKIYYNTTTDVLMVCLGSTWTKLSNEIGDITQVDGGTNINVSGGTSGVATVNLDTSVTDAIDLNTAKNTNVTTNLAITGTTGARVITSSDGTDATIPVATTSVSGVMSTGIFDAVELNTAKVTNVTTNLAITGTTAARTITSSDGTDAIIPLGTTSVSGLLSPALFDEIAANTAKTSDINHNVTTNLAITGTAAARTITSSDGTNATIPVATTSVSGVMSAAQVTTLNAKANTASPTLTGTPAAPTAAANTNTTQIATTAFVQTEITDLIGGAPGTLDTLNELAAAINDDSGYATTLTTALALKAPKASPTFTGTVGGITKGMVGLGSVDNTTDAAKPVSTAQQTEIDTKADIASPTFTGTVGGITKAMVGLGSVNNTTDAAKPVSTAGQTALNLKANLASPTFTGTVAGITKAMVGLGNVANIAVSGTNTGDEPNASTSVKGIVELATDAEALAGTDNTRYVTPKHLGDRGYATAIGDGTETSYAVTHSLGTQRVIVELYDSESYATVYAQVLRTSVNVVTVRFRSAPDTNAITVLITKI